MLPVVKLSMGATDLVLRLQQIQPPDDTNINHPLIILCYTTTYQDNIQ